MKASVEAAARGIARHLRIAREFARIGVRRKSQFRVEFVNQVAMDCIFYATHILSFEFLYRYTDTIAGWDRDATRVFLGCLFVSDAFSMVWLGQGWLFGDDLKKGNLDTLRVRPAAPVVLYFFQRFSLEGVVNLAIAAGYLVFALVSRGELAWWTPFVVLWACALSFWARVVLAVLYSITEFHFMNSDLSRQLHNVFMEVTDRPIDVFHLRMKQFLLFLVPAAAMSYVPAALLVGRMGWVSGAGYTLFLVVFGQVVFRAWRASFKHYESALS